MSAPQHTHTTNVLKEVEYYLDRWLTIDEVKKARDAIAKGMVNPYDVINACNLK